MKKLLFFKVYKNRHVMRGAFFVERPEKITEEYLRDCFEDAFENGNFPVLEGIMMTEEEFENLPEFEGY